MEFEPLEIIYRAACIADITEFFKVKQMTDPAKIEAREKYNKMAAKV